MLEGVTCSECSSRGPFKDNSNCKKCHGTGLECPVCGHGWNTIRNCCTNPKCSDYREVKK